MNRGNWVDIENKLKRLNQKIFESYELLKLTDYEKRRIIFDYLCNHLQYDYNLLEQIKENVERSSPIVRNPYDEFASVLNFQVGICNAIAQFYKMLLEMQNIYSVCVICDDSTSVNHQLNLVYDIDNNVYSFDDITSVIVKRGTEDDFFDYDLDSANKLNQGIRPISENQYWFILPTEYVYYLVGKDTKEYLKYGLEESNELIIPLPSNIVSVKDLYHKNK